MLPRAGGGSQREALRLRGRAGSATGPAPSRVERSPSSVANSAADLMLCWHGAGCSQPPHARLWRDFLLSKGCELKFPVGWGHGECSWAHSPPCGFQKRESPPSSRCLEAGPPLWSRAREPPPPGTKPGPQHLKSGFTSCVSQSPGASHQLAPHMFCPCQPMRIDQGTKGVSTLPSPNKGGLASAKCASPLGGAGRSKKQTADTTMSCSSCLFVFKSHVGLSSP